VTFLFTFQYFFFTYLLLIFAKNNSAQRVAMVTYYVSSEKVKGGT
jgi:hypothetical protein